MHIQNYSCLQYFIFGRYGSVLGPPCPSACVHVKFKNSSSSMQKGLGGVGVQSSLQIKITRTAAIVAELDFVSHLCQESPHCLKTSESISGLLFSEEPANTSERRLFNL